jgi:predicted short-subunit dehydrogenase-like oxidoreductase (DUF2520 family)
VDAADVRAVALIGPGRAGTSIALALVRRGWRVTAVAGRSPDAPSTLGAAVLLGAPAVDVATAAGAAPVVIVATPDGTIEAVAETMAPDLAPAALVVHLAGSLGLGALDAVRRLRPDARVASLHPLQTLPDAESGAARLAGAWAAVAGDPAVLELTDALKLQAITVPDDARAAYHAAACVASNHLVALLGQVERIAAHAGIPFDAFVPLVRASLDNVVALGAAAALTGPAARGDAATISRHVAALPPIERAAYAALARDAARLAGTDAVIDDALDAVLGEVPA